MRLSVCFIGEPRHQHLPPRQRPPTWGCRTQEEGREGFLTRPRFRVLLSSSGMGRYTARATQLAKMVSKMMVSKGLVAPGLRRALK